MICMSCHSYTLHQSVASAPQSNDTHSQIRVGWTIVSSNLKTSPICSMAILVGSPEQVSGDLLTCQGEVLLQDGVPLVTSTH